MCSPCCASRAGRGSLPGTFWPRPPPTACGSGGAASISLPPERVKLARGYGVSHAKQVFVDVGALARVNGLPYQAVFEAALRRMEE